MNDAARRTPWKTLVRLVLAAAVTACVWTVGQAGRALVIAAPLAEPDAIVSLASHEWERLPATARLAHRYPSSTVLLTLPPHVTRSNCYECARRVAWLAGAGVAASRIRIVMIAGSGSGTYGEAVACRGVARPASLRRLLIVTSPYHTRRALAVFRAVFAGTGTELGIEPASAHSPARPDRWWLTPYDRWYVAYEWSAAVYYVLRYGVWPSQVTLA